MIMVKLNTLNIGDTCYIEPYGEMQIREKAAGTVRVSSAEGANFWCDGDTLTSFIHN
jgi:hypothetical protein